MHTGDTTHAGCGGCSRRHFVESAGFLAAGLCALPGCSVRPYAVDATIPRRNKEGARVRAAFIYPPSKRFADDPDGWWSWPGNDFDAEGRQKQYAAALGKIERKLDMTIACDPDPVADDGDARTLIEELKASPPDGLLLVLFYNRSLKLADLLLAEAGKLGIPVVFYIGLGVKHGSVARYRRPGVYLIQSLDNVAAIENGMRMINAKKLLAQSRLLSITNRGKPRTGVEKTLGITVKVIATADYTAAFEKCALGADDRKLIAALTGGAREVRDVTPAAIENAVRAHRVMKQLIAEHEADAVTMRCLRAGMLKPCISFSLLNDALLPAACENDLPAAYTQMLGQLLTGRPGFQHNPCYETEKNHYFASHCTCPTMLGGPSGARRDYMLRHFLHSNEGSCAIQVFWKPGDPVTMVRYYPGAPAKLDVYAGRAVTSHAIPPAGGCTTNVEVAITDRPDACMVKGHHNLLFVGDYARQFRLFARLHRMELAET